MVHVNNDAERTALRIWAISDLHLPGGSSRRQQRLEFYFGLRDYFAQLARALDALVQPDQRLI